MKNIETLYVKDRNEWRTWLEQYHHSEKEIWLIYYKKHSNKPRIPYDDAVEEALCFGWIDSLVKTIDDEKYMQKLPWVSRALHYDYIHPLGYFFIALMDSAR